MAAPRILLVGNDAAPSNAFKKLIPYLEDQHMSTASFILEAGSVPPPSAAELEAQIGSADIVLIGMSTPQKNARIETSAASIAKRMGKPFGFYSDTHGAWTRPHFAEFSNAASFVFVVNEDERHKAKDAFPNAAISATGNPLWEAFFQPADRCAARARMGASKTDRVVLAPGTKNPMHNMSVWTALIQAAAQVGGHHVVLARHIGDETPPEVYNWYRTFGGKLGASVHLCTSDPNELVPGADLVVNGTSVRVHAIARRIPVIDYYEPLSQQWLEADIGSRFSYFHGSGAVSSVYGGTWQELAASLRSFASHPHMLTAGQESSVEPVRASEVMGRMYRGLQNVLAAA